jgi:hypothetical protein
MYWDDTNNRLGVGTTTPLGILHLKSTAAITRMVIDGDAGFNRLISYRTGAVQRFGLYVNNTAESGSNAGSDFAIRAYSDAGTLLNTPIFIKRSTGQVTFSERVNVESDSLVTTQTSSVIQATTTNANLVIAPNGTGALIASIPDGTVTGGNARGNNAVDLQMVRSAANQVASSNNSTIAGGVNNRAYGIGVFIGGGSGNSAGGLDDYQVITGGLNNTINASGGAFIGGGLSNSIAGGGTGYQVIAGGRSNVGGATYTTISGGQTNTANSGTHATVVGGQSNTSSGQYSVTGGNLNIASALGTTVFGQSNNATVRWAFAVGMQNNNGGGDAAATIGYQNTISINALSSMALGYGHTINGAYSTGLGADTLTYLYGQVSSAASLFANDGDAQQSLLTARRSAILTTGGTTTLSLDGTGTTNLIIPNGTNRMWNVTIKFVAVVTTITGTATGVTVGDTKSQNIEIGFKKVGGVSSLVGSGVYSIPQEDASMGSASLIPTAGASQQLALTFTAPTFTGGGSVTCRVVAKVELVEVAY